MKNIVIFVLVLGLLVTGYIAATTNLKMSLEGMEGKTERIVRGDLTLPINATGEVKPSRRVEVKSEASGEVIEIHRRPGDRVKVGDLLIRLQKDDEQRNVNKARLDLRAAEARLETSKLNLERSKGADLDVAKSRVDQLRENSKLTEYRWKKLKSLDPKDTNEEELLTRETAHAGQLAQLHEAEAGYERAKLAVPQAEQELKQSEAAFERAENTLADAEKLLDDTDITAPIDGVVGLVSAEVGDVIQGGKTTFTAGTILATVLELDRIIVAAEVDESDIARVREIAPSWAIPRREPGLTMPENIEEAARTMEHLPVVTVESFRDEEFQGVIELISPEPRVLSGVVTYTVDVVIVSPNRDLLLPGMRADVSFTSEHLENVLLCPNEAIREGIGGKLGEYLPGEDGGSSDETPKFVPCKFGISNGTYSHVLCDQLSEGTVVYTKQPAKRDREKEN